MISDVLFEAVEELRRYQREFRCYDGLEPEINQVIIVMDALRKKLDEPPERDANGNYVEEPKHI